MTSPKERPTRLLLIAAGTVAMALLLAACAGEDSLGKKAAVATGFATQPVEPVGFVTNQRPASTDYMPVGVPPPARPSVPKTAAELAAAEKSLADTRTAIETAGAEAKAAGDTPPPTPAPGLRP